jgi:hypothetical protein
MPGPTATDLLREMGKTSGRLGKSTCEKVEPLETRECVEGDGAGSNGGVEARTCPANVDFSGATGDGAQQCLRSYA